MIKVAIIFFLSLQVMLLADDYVPKPVKGFRCSEFALYQMGNMGEHRVRISEDIELVCKFRETAKGNGSLCLYYKDKLTLKMVSDRHDDGFYYEKGFLPYFFVDINGDGVLELVVSGIGIYTPEQGDYIVKKEWIYQVYQYNLKKHQWDLIVDKKQIGNFAPEPVMGLGKEDILKNTNPLRFSGSGEHRVEIAEKLNVNVKINIINKGEGTLKIYQGKEPFSFNIYDNYIDVGVDIEKEPLAYCFYLEAMLYYCLVDIDGDNVLELVISGTLCDTQTKNPEASYEKKRISKCFKYDKETRTWNLFEADKLMKKSTESELKK